MAEEMDMFARTAVNSGVNLTIQLGVLQPYPGTPLANSHMRYDDKIEHFIDGNHTQFWLSNDSALANILTTVRIMGELKSQYEGTVKFIFDLHSKNERVLYETPSMREVMQKSSGLYLYRK
ncbi:MAG TPA: hypothetical protein VFF28_02020 [Candidatus Nanoarchaeia archaeon]|nr:hypothetical protein [Candidatus Nanoarchaeia archaeon]